MMPAINIRRITLADVKPLRNGPQNFYDTFTGTCTDEDMNGFLKSISMKGRLQKNWVGFFFAEADGVPAGYMRFKEDYSRFSIDETMEKPWNWNAFMYRNSGVKRYSAGIDGFPAGILPNIKITRPFISAYGSIIFVHRILCPVWIWKLRPYNIDFRLAIRRRQIFVMKIPLKIINVPVISLRASPRSVMASHCGFRFS